MPRNNRAHAARGNDKERKTMSKILCHAALCLAFSGAAQAAAPSVDQYGGDALIATLQCKIKQAAYGMDGGAERYGELLRCVNTQKTALKASYDKASKSVKKPAAKSALKE